MMDAEDTITTEHAARRFHQMARTERALSEKCAEIADCQNQLKELRKEEEALILRLRAAARNEGDLPLFNL